MALSVRSRKRQRNLLIRYQSTIFCLEEMAVFSKYFYQVVNAQKCTEVIHDGTCLESTIWNFTKTISGCVKFVLPLALVGTNISSPSHPYCLAYQPFFRFRSSWKADMLIKRLWSAVWRLLSTIFWELGWLEHLVCPLFASSGNSNRSFEVKLKLKLIILSLETDHGANTSRRVFGTFSYYSVLAYPSALGAIVCSRVLTDQVIYYYAHGLSTIVN